jgi:hypothetical protein
LWVGFAPEMRSRKVADQRRIAAADQSMQDDRRHYSATLPLGRLSTKIPLQEGKAAHGQALLIGFAFGNQALKVSLEFRKPPLKVTDDPHEVAGVFDALDRLVENVYFRAHVGSLAPARKNDRAPSVGELRPEFSYVTGRAASLTA